LGPFGDALLTTSYFETLKRKFDGATIHYLIKEPYHKIIEGHPLIDDVILIRKANGLEYYLERIRTYRKVISGRFDLIIDQQNQPSTQSLTLLSGAQYRLGYLDGRFGFAYNLKAPRGELRYSGSRKFDILRPLGIMEEPYKLHIHIGDEAYRYIENWIARENLTRGKLVTISPGSPVLMKQWSLDSYAELADQIQNRLGLTTVLLWGPDERKRIEYVASRMQTDTVLAPRTDFAQAGALLKNSLLLICNDGGVNHLSVATGTPSLALFGNTNPTVWSPAEVFPIHQHLYNPRHDSRHDASFGIAPETAFDKVNELLDSLDTFSDTLEA
jgi:ADP-heptose:LPS heptosyltransferase